jgi:HD-like signal output (HDOD) protein
MTTPSWEETIMRLPEADVRAALLLHWRFPYEVTQAINSVVGRRSG